MTTMVSSLHESDGSSNAMEDVLKEGDCAEKMREKMEDDAHQASIGRQKLLSTTQFIAAEVSSNV